MTTRAKAPNAAQERKAQRPARERGAHGERSTGFIALIVDAWHELRVNRLRIMLALVGITVAVIGLTGALGFGQIAISMTQQTSDRGGGRTATILVSGSNRPDQIDLMRRLPQDFDITYSTMQADTMATVWTPSTRIGVQLRAVEPSYEVIYRQPLSQGRFLSEADADLRAPAIVINDKLWQVLGKPNIDEGASLEFRDGSKRQVFTIVGVAPRESEYESPSALVLFDQLDAVPGVDTGQVQVSVALWVPPEIGDDLTNQLSEQLVSKGMSVYRSDWGQQAAESLALIVILVVAAAAGMFILGALGLININLVTLQQRVREIGIRRSYGATSSRIFFGVLLESVVATFVAGLVGVALTVAVLQNPLLIDYLKTIGLVDPPPFPLVPALVGLAASTLVGALAGALPAIRATRIQIVDAIRY